MADLVSHEFLRHVKSLEKEQRDELWKRNRNYPKHQTFPLHQLISKCSFSRNADKEVVSAILKFA